MTYIASKCKKIYLACERLTHLDIAVGHLCCVRGGHSDFRFCGFGYFFGSVFRFFCAKKTAKHGTLPEFLHQRHLEVGDQVTGHT